MRRKIGRVYLPTEKRMFYPDMNSAVHHVYLKLDGTIVCMNNISEEAKFDRFAFSTDNETPIDIYENDIVLGGRCAALVCMDRYSYLTFKYQRKKEQIKKEECKNITECDEVVIRKSDNYDLMNWLHVSFGDFPNIKKVLGNIHENPELLQLTKNNPQPYSEEDKVEFIDFSLPINDNFSMSGFVLYLIKQQINLYRQLGKKISPIEFDDLCRYRGFNVNEKNFLIKCLKTFEFGAELQFDTTHESIKKSLYI